MHLALGCLGLVLLLANPGTSRAQDAAKRSTCCTQTVRQCIAVCKTPAGKAIRPDFADCRESCTREGSACNRKGVFRWSPQLGKAATNC